MVFVTYLWLTVYDPRGQPDPQAYWAVFGAGSLPSPDSALCPSVEWIDNSRGVGTLLVTAFKSEQTVHLVTFGSKQ